MLAYSIGIVGHCYTSVSIDKAGLTRFDQPVSVGSKLVCAPTHHISIANIVTYPFCSYENSACSGGHSEKGNFWQLLATFISEESPKAAGDAGVTASFRAESEYARSILLT